MSRELTPREQEVLEAVIQEYIQDAHPVGSRQLAKNYNLNVSPATIRNAMADLEDMGYLTHPHTSAGRIPTDEGYRYYVDTLMELTQLTGEERQMLSIYIDPYAQDIEDILQRMSKALGRLSDELGIVFTPRFYQGILEKIELVELSSDKLLVVVQIRTGLVKTVMIEVRNSIPRKHLRHISRVLNERLAGLTLSEVKETIDKRFRDIKEGQDELVQLIVNNAHTVFNFVDRPNIHISGTRNIIRQPELQDPEKITRFLDLVEENKLTSQIFKEFLEGEEELLITIGSENKYQEVSEFSIVASTYTYGNLRGTLAVMGPTRMYYNRVAALVQVAADTITQSFEEL